MVTEATARAPSAGSENRDRGCASSACTTVVKAYGGCGGVEATRDKRHRRNNASKSRVAGCAAAAAAPKGYGLTVGGVPTPV